MSIINIKSVSFILFISLFLSSVQIGYAQKSYENISSLCSDLDVVGLRVIVVQDTSKIYDYHYGQAIHKNNGTYSYTQFTGNDLWKVASVTKNFIALAVMQLSERNFLSLNNDINKYLPDKVIHPLFPKKKISIKMLLSHRSGILNDRYERLDYEGLKFSDYRPDTKYIYSNVNYLLLASIVENVTGVRFDRYIDENIFKPLKIKGYFYPYDSLRSNLIYGKWLIKRTNELKICNTYQWYRKNVIDNYILSESTKGLDPAGGLIMTIDDMAKYVIYCMNNKRYNKAHVIKNKNLKKMRIPLSEEMKYGLGTIDYSNILPGETLYGHTGYSYGIYTCIMYNPDKHYGFVIFCNGAKVDSSKALSYLHAPIIKILYKNLLLN